jgi:2-C-methyl-D-erythritol 4-phosphate cytidylyltransferase/2-C-methyl-D-erythritol 2,4-cyclodiphosphate synthase
VIDRLLDALDRRETGSNPVLPVVDSLAMREGELMGDARAARGTAPGADPAGLPLRRYPRGAPTLGAARPSAGDDAQVARAAGLAVALVEGDEACTS